MVFDRFLSVVLVLSILFLVVSNYCEIKILLGFTTTYCTMGRI